MTIGEIIKRRRKELGISADKLAEAIKKDRATIYRYENGFIENISLETLDSLAEALQTTPAYLMGWDNIYQCSDDENPWELKMSEEFEKLDIDTQIAITKQMEEITSGNATVLRLGTRPIATKRLPVLGNVACGEPIFANESCDTYIDVDSDFDADFCLTAKGDSMINARIFDGDILFVKSQDIVDDGEIAVVLIEDEATVKRVFYDRENGILTLVPENPTYKPMRYSGEQLDHIRILGKVVLGQYRI